jgi:dTDP-D-glucose 4,6-dehydratase
MRILLTGGAGFIGSAVIRHLILDMRHTVLNADSLTYAGNLQNFSSINPDLDIYWPDEEKKLSPKDNLLRALTIEKSIITEKWQHL